MKKTNLDDYIYVRMNKSIKKQIKERAEKEGSNSTIWVRQLIIKTLQD